MRRPGKIVRRIWPGWKEYGRQWHWLLHPRIPLARFSTVDETLYTVSHRHRHPGLHTLGFSRAGKFRISARIASATSASVSASLSRNAPEAKTGSKCSTSASTRIWKCERERDSSAHTHKKQPPPRRRYGSVFRRALEWCLGAVKI